MLIVSSFASLGHQLEPGAFWLARGRAHLRLLDTVVDRCAARARNEDSKMQ
jgi:hypothetical protein